MQVLAGMQMSFFTVFFSVCCFIEIFSWVYVVKLKRSAGMFSNHVNKQTKTQKTFWRWPSSTSCSGLCTRTIFSSQCQKRFLDSSMLLWRTRPDCFTRHRPTLLLDQETFPGSYLGRHARRPASVDMFFVNHHILFINFIN